jgi:hypothetical protein
MSKSESLICQYPVAPRRHTRYCSEVLTLHSVECFWCSDRSHLCSNIQSAQAQTHYSGGIHTPICGMFLMSDSESFEFKSVNVLMQTRKRRCCKAPVTSFPDCCFCFNSPREVPLSTAHVHPKIAYTYIYVYIHTCLAPSGQVQRTPKFTRMYVSMYAYVRMNSTTSASPISIPQLVKLFEASQSESESESESKAKSESAFY